LRKRAIDPSALFVVHLDALPCVYGDNHSAMRMQQCRQGSRAGTQLFSR
jgi:hypothetical protein